ncbi:hypothetical protein HU200_039144 [Digitaria exilis]|uniref:DUF3615 domain-containing protein n=1 Tax=Digitaria exilis TaxID=1010633 RepID=A0A835BK03_9POAL|nr:hypothetical protein HU200_039144 [Digitaria exilis]
MKANGSVDWTTVLFFAEVKEILRQKIYFCSPLELYKHGHCYACKKQGMDDLRHPIIGVYDRANPDTVSPSCTKMTWTASYTKNTIPMSLMSMLRLDGESLL